MRRCAALALLAALPAAAAAHSFGRLYNLPVPLWLYLYGAAAALLASFLALAWFGAQAAEAPATRASHAGWRMAWLAHPLIATSAKLISLGLLLLAIISGFAGSQNPYLNFNMSGFWVGFVLGFAYLVALCGDLYARLNPWRLIVRGIERLSGPWTGKLAAPAWLGVWPALLLYMGFIWIELFGGTGPRQLSVLLCGYTLINLMGAWLLGTASWFRQGEFFAVFLRLLAWCAPLHWQQGRLQLRWPFAGLLNAKVQHGSLLLFILFMLSSTAFDGLRETVPWVKLFWQQLYQPLWAPLLGESRVESYPQLKAIYAIWQTAALLLAPFAYLAAYLLCLKLAQWLTRSPPPLRMLALRFAPALIPIALVYHLTHYYTLLFTQGTQLPWLLSDPLGTGSEWAWRWLGAPPAVIPDAAAVWHTQVGLIVLGHIVSVLLAHRIALQVFATRRQAVLSQLPMLLLMMLYTGSGLWILAQPLTAGG